MTFSSDLRAKAFTLLAEARAKGLKIATAESCTGGLIAGLLTEIAGSSDVFERGFVTYSNDAKHDMLGVRKALIDKHGAVSEEVARAMAQGALESRPPLGLLTDFVTTDADGAPGSIDLKTQGTRPFIDAARIFALASGSVATSTAQRLRASGEHLRIPHDETEEAVEAFHFILLYRLRHQQHDPAQGNRIRPDALNELDRQILKEAFRQARKLQSRLALDYQL